MVKGVREKGDVFGRVTRNVVDRNGRVRRGCRKRRRWIELMGGWGIRVSWDNAAEEKKEVFEVASVDIAEGWSLFGHAQWRCLRV